MFANSTVHDQKSRRILVKTKDPSSLPEFSVFPKETNPHCAYHISSVHKRSLWTIVVDA